MGRSRRAEPLCDDAAARPHDVPHPRRDPPHRVQRGFQRDGGRLTPKKKRQLTEAEKEYKSKRKQIQEKLIKFATRIPIFMYLTDFREYCLKDIITQLEPRLFRRVTGITVEDFELLVSIGIFNDSLMNSAVYNFKRYEDASLAYTGIQKHSDEERVGLFSTVISKADYEAMAEAQQASLLPSKARLRIARPKEPAHPATGPAQGFGAADRAAEHAEAYGKRQETGQDVPQIAVGTMVLHKKFGEGRVSKLTATGKIMISFPTYAPKTFLFPQAFEQGYLTVKADGFPERANNF